MSRARSTTFMPHCRVLASAGSGKTYQLTSRYLALIQHGAPPAGILATTFTRAAAGEIRNRIMMRLVEAAHDEEKRNALGEAIGRATITADEVVNVLREITENLHRLQIRTLDSFFASIVQTFSLDLGLSDGCRIVDEADIVTLRDEAVALMLDEDNPQPMIDLLRHLTVVDGGRPVHETINQQVRELYELFRETKPAAWEAIAPPKGRMTESQLVDAIETLEALPLRTTNGHWVNARNGDLGRAQSRNWSTFLKGGIAKKIVAGEESFQKCAIESEDVAAYQPLIQHALAELIERQRRRNIAAHRLLELFHGHYEHLKRRDGVMTFSDLSRLLSDLLRGGSAESESDINRFMEICFRLDGTIDHLLLDEFQDTSITQWKAMQPIVAEIMAGEGDRPRSFFCVGDVKQSIYGWRHASPEVLSKLDTLIHENGSPANLETATLAKSWRSSQTIIDCVNRVFGNLPSNRALKEYPIVAQRWHEAFERHETEKTELPGYVELRMMERTDDSDADVRAAHRLKEAAKLAAALHRRAPHLSIAILTRSNKSAGRLLFELGLDGPEQLNVPAGGRGQGSLTDAPVVEALLDLLALADHPDDTIAAYHVANSPAAELINVKSDFAEKTNWQRRAEVSRRLRDTFAEDGYARTIASWLPMLAPSCTEREIGRLLQLIEVAERFDADGGGRADQLVRLVTQTDIPDVRPAPIQVMTVHKAKGLEFDAVILADLESTLRGKPPVVVYERDGDVGPITRICRYMNANLQRLLPELAPMFEATVERSVREHLSLLYVAITRARHGLYMFVDPPKEKRKTTDASLASVVIDSLADDTAQPGNVLYQDGKENWCELLGAKKPAAASERTPVVMPIQIPKAKRRVVKAHDAPSKHFDDAEGATVSQRRNRDADDRGTALHALLQQVDWLDNSASSLEKNALDRQVRAAVRGRSAEWRTSVLDEFLAILQNPNLKQLLTQSVQLGDAESVEAHRELSFARIISGAAQRGSIDRLVVRKNGGTVVGAVVIDFKSDQIGPKDDPQKCAQRYVAQLDDYQAAAARLLRVEPSMIERIVFFLMIDQAVGLA